MRTVRFVLAAPFGALAFLFMFVAGYLAKAAMAISGLKADGLHLKVSL